ncbi:MAG: amidase [Sphingomonadales bacterium]|jgi:amidase|nr:amidase [Sphingomonadales bacterium]MBK9002920.1 amidase [Sphingomonadales bacterium]MBK9268168.1 amidase [Sphingomonadales bacterium]MBP6434281.1 amidase [Sphingorhabdus sp.]
MAFPKLHSEPTAIELAGQIARGELSAVEATEAAIARIEALDGPINAVVVRDFGRARDQARLCDRARAAGQAGPLNGVPMTVKESYDIAGLKTTWGFEFARDFVADEDAHAVKRLKQAGAVILGKTNVPVALADLQSVNPIHGRTNNPHDLSRVPGGSSGGGAAALASGMVPLEFGSDIGGSIRTPCHFCGVTGLKPTYGAIPFDGHYFPGMKGAPTVMAMTGPMARSAADLALALDLTSTLPLPRARAGGLKGARILLIESHPVADLDGAVAAALRAAADKAADAGAIIEHRSDLLPDLEAMHANYMKLLNIALAVRQPQSGDRPELAARDWLTLLDKQADRMREWQALFGEYDAIFAPVFGTTAFPHSDDPDWRKRSLTLNGQPSPFHTQIAWIALATYPGLPSVSVPVGGHEGLPIGIQVIAPHWQDHTAVALSGEIGRLCGTQ